MRPNPNVAGDLRSEPRRGVFDLAVNNQQDDDDDRQQLV